MANAIIQLARQQPARAGLVRPKMRYAHQGGMNPPVIVIHGNSLQHVADSYTRYLTQTFRKVFNLQGTPLRIQCVCHHASARVVLELSQCACQVLRLLKLKLEK